MRKSIGAVILAILLFLAFALDDKLSIAVADRGNVLGEYQVTGWEPGDNFDSQPAYSGTVEVRKRGDAYHFEGIVDAEKFIGVGFFLPEKRVLSLAFKGLKSGRMGQTVFEVEGGVLSGRWTYLDDREGKVGKEIWKRVE